MDFILKLLFEQENEYFVANFLNIMKSYERELKFS
jgi:hypothetical protein